MRRTAFTLACLAFAGAARRVQITSGQLQDSLRDKGDLRSFARYFATLNAAAGWQACRAGHRCSPASIKARARSPRSVSMREGASTASPELLGVSALARYRAPLERPAVERMLRACRNLRGPGNLLKGDFRRSVGVSTLSEAVAADAVFDAFVCGKGTVLQLDDVEEALAKYAGDDLSALEADILQARINFALTWLGFNAFQTTVYYTIFAAQVLRNLGVPMFGKELADGVALAENPEVLKAGGLAASIAIAIATTLTLQLNQKFEDDF